LTHERRGAYLRSVPGQVQVRDELTTGLEAYSGLDDPRPHYEVTWIRWDSGFRGTGLRVGDHIIAVGDQPIVRPQSIQEAQRTSYKAIGQYAESQRWQELGMHDGDGLVLTVERPAASGAGWERAMVKGEIRSTRAYYDSDSRETLGSDGPRVSEYDPGPDYQWRNWYEALVKQLSKVLRIWWSTSFDSRREMEALLESYERKEYLIKTYPGPFASALDHDFEAAVQLIQGRTYALTEQDLRYRKAEAEKVQRTAELAQAAWATFQEAHAAEILPKLPTIHPVRDDRGPVTGKLVALPTVGERDWIGEMDRYFFGVDDRSSGGTNWFFVDVYGDAATRMREAAYRYGRLVQPDIRKNYTMIGRILPDPSIVYTRGGSQIGFQVEPVAALVGDGAMFVDLTERYGADSRFAGEEELTRPSVPATDADSSPKQVLESFFSAIKDGDEASWRGCFADWSAFFLDDGRIRIHPYSPRTSSLEWESARRHVLKDVYGIAVVWEGETRDLATGEEYAGAPRLQEVEIWIEHIGLFDGQYRAFTSPFYHRRWRLQRLNGSPWRISDDFGF
jgi:hypothetical protein